MENDKRIKEYDMLRLVIYVSAYFRKIYFKLNVKYF